MSYTITDHTSSYVEQNLFHSKHQNHTDLKSKTRNICFGSLSRNNLKGKPRPTMTIYLFRNNFSHIWYRKLQNTLAAFFLLSEFLQSRRMLTWLVNLLAIKSLTIILGTCYGFLQVFTIARHMELKHYLNNN